MWRYLFNSGKLAYVKGRKPSVSCILCAIRDRDPAVESMELYRDDYGIVTVNLYPFNPGQLMIFPLRHVEDLRDLRDDEAAAMHRLLCRSLSAIADEYSPSGFNVGFNMGRGSGESIAHIHQHVIPRYGNEVGFVDIIAGTRLVVNDPREVVERLRGRFAR